MTQSFWRAAARRRSRQGKDFLRYPYKLYSPQAINIEAKIVSFSLGPPQGKDTLADKALGGALAAAPFVALSAGAAACLFGLRPEAIGAGLICASLAQFGLSRAVVSRRAARKIARRAAEAKIFAALEGMSQSIGAFDRAGKLIGANGAFLRMFKLTAASAAGVPAAALLGQKLGARPKTPEAMAELAAAADSCVKKPQRRNLTLDLADERSLDFLFQPSSDGFMLLIEDCSARRAAEARAERMARVDELTGLANRTRFREVLAQATAEADPKPFAVLLIDLDRFKHVNDSLGHPVGDQLLARVAKRMSEVIVGEDLVARVGGDEFVILHFGDAEQAAAFAAQTVELLTEPFAVAGVKLTIAASIGVACAPRDSQDADELIKSADMALYAAKDSCRGGFRFFEKRMAEQARRKQEIERDLRAGLLHNEIEVHYQPIISLGKRRISACEALARWRHPGLGMVSPGEFMPIAEESGLIVQLGEQVLRQSCLDARSWPREVRVAVNFSGVQFARSNVVEMVRRVLRETKFPAPRLEVEITESVLIDDVEATLAMLDELRDMGVRVALDDFGTGYSSLAYLGRFRPDKVKIDQSFVRGMEKNRSALAIIKAVKALTVELGVDMLVEGVETMEQFEILRAHGADEAQGFLFSRPRPASEVARLVADPAQFVRGRKLMTDSGAPWTRGFERVNPSVAQGSAQTSAQANAQTSAQGYAGKFNRAR